MNEHASQPLRMGVISCADIAWRRMLPAMAASPDVDLVAIASRERKRATRAAERFGGEAGAGYEWVLDRPDVDAVYLPLPTGLHREWVARALAAGKHVLVEKPLTTGHREAAELIRTARRRRLVLMENFTFLHHSQHHVVQQLLADGVIGDLRTLTSHFGVPPRKPDDFRYRSDLGGGALFDVGVYPVRAAMMFLGPRLEVRGATLRPDPALAVDLAGRVLLSTPEHVTAQLSFGFEHGYQCQYSLWGSDGRLFLDRAFTPPGDLRPVVRIERQDHVEELTLPAEDQFAKTLGAFVRAVRDGPRADSRHEPALELASLVDSIRWTAGQPGRGARLTP